MIRAKDFDTMVDCLSNLGLPFKEIISRENINVHSEEINLNVMDTSQDQSVYYRFSIQREFNGDYISHDYLAKMLIVPIEHGHYAGIDTLNLERQMKEIKWALFLLYNNDALRPFFLQLDQLRTSGDATAKEIADKLSLKYFANTVLEDILPLPDRSPYEKMIVVPIHNNGNDIDIEQAVLLLKGGSLLKYHGNEESGELCWVKEEKGYLKVYPDFDVSETIKQMPFVKQPDIIELSEMLAGLGKGKQYETSLMINSRIVPGSIYVKPEDKTLEVRNDKGKIVNWQLWTKLNQNKKPGKGKKGPGF
ncbi:hypothetical protein [Sphingobacterium puteale]|uniref:hypothetical protein n=1 Tax=Sphingobacterium puteale TaxID=2420510 RepID=UPI003D9813CA